MPADDPQLPLALVYPDDEADESADDGQEHQQSRKMYSPFRQVHLRPLRVQTRKRWFILYPRLLAEASGA